MIYYSIISIGIFILGTKLYPSIKLKFAPKNLLTKNQNEFKFNYSEDTDKLNVVGPLEVGENILISFEGRMGHILSSQSVWLQTQGIISTDHLFEIDLKSLKLPIGYYKIIIKLKTHFKNLHFFIGKKPSDFDLKLRGIVEGERKNFLAEKDKLFQLSTDMLNQSKMFNFKTREYRKDKAQLKAYVDLWTNKNIKNWKELSLNKESQFFSRQYEEILSIQNQIELILLPYLQQVNYQEQASKKHEQINTDQIEDLLNEIGFISKSFL